MSALRDTQEPEPRPWPNRLSFGLGTLGRDMTGALVSLYLMYYLTEVLDLPPASVVGVTVILVAMRIFDAFNDPFMGVIVDNTRSRWGKFKPWIAGGALGWALATVGLFVDFGLSGWQFLLVFALVYLIWEIAYTVNDISFYGMLPSLSRSQKEREAIGVIARISANVGLFAVVIAVLPVTTALGRSLGNPQLGWLIFAGILALLMLAFQSLTLRYTRQRIDAPVEHTPLRELFGVIARNDQVLWVTLAMLVFMTAYLTTVSLGVYYFKYVYLDESMYSVFATVLGVAQIIGLAIFPLVAARLRRSRIHALGIALCVAGLVTFWFAGRSMPVIAFAGVLLFVGQAFIQLLMLMYITDCVEYGEWKLGRRNESVTLSLQPFIYKGSNALGTALVGIVVVASGISGANQPADVSAEGILLFKFVMMVIPIILILASWFILRTKYVIDESRYAEIIADLRVREGVTKVTPEP